MSTSSVKKDQVKASQLTQNKPELAAQFKDVPIDHFGKHGNTTGDEEYRMPHPVWY